MITSQPNNSISNDELTNTQKHSAYKKIREFLEETKEDKPPLMKDKDKSFIISKIMTEDNLKDSQLLNVSHELERILSRITRENEIKIQKESRNQAKIKFTTISMMVVVPLALTVADFYNVLPYIGSLNDRKLVFFGYGGAVIAGIGSLLAVYAEFSQKPKEVPNLKKIGSVVRFVGAFCATYAILVRMNIQPAIVTHVQNSTGS